MWESEPSATNSNEGPWVEDDSTTAISDGQTLGGYTFCEFMEDSLHHPAWGYYSEGRVRFGEQAAWASSRAVATRRLAAVICRDESFESVWIRERRSIHIGHSCSMHLRWKG